MELKSPDRFPDKPAFDIFLLVSANLIWGGTDVAAKLAMSEMTPEALAWTRFTIALLAFAPALWVNRSEIPRSIRGLAPFVVLGACGFFLNQVLTYRGLKLAPASHATALRVTESLVIAALSAIFLREHIGKKTTVALVAGLVGVILVLNVDLKNLSLFASGYRFGDMLILASIFIESFYTIIGKKVLAKTRPLTSTALACFFGWLMMSIFYGGAISREFIRHPPSVNFYLLSAYLGLIANAFGYWVYYEVLSRRASHRVGISIMIQPMVGIPLAAAVFGDSITPKFLIGALLIAAGVYMALGKEKHIE